MRIAIKQNSSIANEIYPNATGTSGNIKIQAGSLNISDFGQISASIFGQGKSGNIDVDVKDNTTMTGSNNFSIITGPKANLTGIGIAVASTNGTVA